MTPNEERWARQHHVDRELWHKAGEAGLLCAGIPESLGGGGTFAHEAVAIEEQQQRRLPGMASGDLVAAIAMTEPEAALI